MGQRRSDGFMLLDELDAQVDLKTLASKGITKNRNREVRRFSSSHIDRFVEIEPGAPLNGFLSVLKHIKQTQLSEITFDDGTSALDAPENQAAIARLRAGNTSA